MVLSSNKPTELSLRECATAQLTVEVPGDLRLTVQWLSDAIFVLGHDPEHVFVSLHQALHRPDPVFGFAGDRHPVGPARHPLPDDIVCDLGASIVLWRQPGECDPLCSDLLKLNGSRGRTWSTWRTNTSQRQPKPDVTYLNDSWEYNSLCICSL